MTFKAGQSGNPSGRPKKTAADRAVEELAREHTPKAMRALAEIIDDPKHPARATASIYMIDRGYGRPAQTVNAKVKGQYLISDLLTPEQWEERFCTPDDPDSPLN